MIKKITLGSYLVTLALYPILALRSQNLVYIKFISVVRSLLLSLLLAIILLLIYKLIIKRWDKARLLATLTLVLFFSYGHIYLQLQELLEFPVRHRYLAVIFAIMFLLFSVLIIRLKNTLSIEQYLTVFGLILFVFPFYQAVNYDFSVARATRLAEQDVREKVESINSLNTQELPDIYLIILDGYTRSDILKDVYNYDNSAFINELEDMGFYVAKCSQSNYPITKYSLSSVMNADYVENYSNLSQLPPLKDGFVNETVQALDYVTIAFENSVGGHFDLFEDIHISQSIGLIDFVGGFNEFEAELFKTTLLQMLYDMPQLIPGFQIVDLQKAEYYEHYRQTLFILDELKNIPQMEGHKFVFAHVLTPHPPYVFTPSGDFYWTDNDRKGYPSNAKFISSHVLPVIEEIISTSTIPPVIIIQGDHGAYGNFITPQMRLSILNAYYVDQETQESLYNTITPVNSFRIIFNNYFGADYPLLEDISYFMHGAEEFIPENVVENKCLSE